MNSIQSILSPPKNAPKWTVSSEYNATSRFSESQTPTTGEELIIRRRGSYGSAGSSSSGSFSTPSTESSSRTSVGNTPLLTALSSSRPRNLLDLIYQTQAGSEDTRNEGDSLEQITDNSDSSPNSYDSDDY